MDTKKIAVHIKANNDLIPVLLLHKPKNKAPNNNPTIYIKITILLLLI